jgi:hypothetical protein
MHSKHFQSTGRRRRAAALVSAALGAIACVTVAGCQGLPRTTMHAVAVEREPGPDDELAFLDELDRVPLVSTHDALHALLLFAGEAPAGLPGSAPTWADRVMRAQELGWIAADTWPEPRRSASLGLVSSIVVKVSRVRGGATLAVVGDEPWSGRFGAGGGLVGATATRELRQLRIVPDRSANQALSGRELLAILRRAEDYERFGRVGERDPLPDAAADPGGPGGLGGAGDSGDPRQR